MYFLTKDGKPLNLNWYFELWRKNNESVEPKIHYDLSVHDGEYEFELARNACIQTEVLRGKIAQRAYVGKRGIDPAYIRVDLDVNNINKLMQQLGLSKISPEDFYQFVGILMQDIDFPAQISAPTDSKYCKNIGKV